MDVVSQAKHDIRRLMRERRRALAPEARAHAAASVCAKLAADEDVAATANAAGCRRAVAVYIASSEEIDLSDFIQGLLRGGVAVVAPRWNGKSYELARLQSLSKGSLRRGPMGILEPAAAEIADNADVAVWIVPGLAFTAGGKRLGYGGGWYDRLLAEAAADSVKIGVAHDFQMVDDLPGATHDIPMDRVVVA